MTTHIHLTYMERKNLITAYPNKITTLVNKEATSSAYEALTVIGFNPYQTITELYP